MIPKIIHYCWFGGNPLPEYAQKYIAGWKEHCPDYEFMLWNEDNFDINTVPFTAQVAKAKRWGFIVDYVRAHIVYNYGGIYLDVDVELLKPFDDAFLRNKCFSGFESKSVIAPGLVFAGEKGCAIAKELMDFYTEYNFIKENGELNLTPSPQIFTSMLMKYGLKKENKLQRLGVFTAYPTEYFCPKSFLTGLTNITENTVAIHHYDASWLSSGNTQKVGFRYKVYARLGDNILSRFIHMTHSFLARFFVEEGPASALRYYWRKVFRKQ